MQLMLPSGVKTKLVNVTVYLEHQNSEEDTDYHPIDTVTPIGGMLQIIPTQWN